MVEDTRKPVKETIRCWEVRECTEEERKDCSAFKLKKSCWKVMSKNPPVQCAKDLKVCVAKKCSVFMDNASDVAQAWLNFIKFSHKKH